MVKTFGNTIKLWSKYVLWQTAQKHFGLLLSSFPMRDLNPRSFRRKSNILTISYTYNRPMGNKLMSWHRLHCHCITQLVHPLYSWYRTEAWYALVLKLLHVNSCTTDEVETTVTVTRAIQSSQFCYYYDGLDDIPLGDTVLDEPHSAMVNVHHLIESTCFLSKLVTIYHPLLHMMNTFISMLNVIIFSSSTRTRILLFSSLDSRRILHLFSYRFIRR